MRISYWSDSRLVKWLFHKNGIYRTPLALTFEDWDIYHARFQKDHPILTGITKYLDKIQDVVRIPINRYEDIHAFINNAFIYKEHVLQTRLAYGKYHEIDNRILHALFETLIDYVEIELAQMQIICSSKEEAKKYYSIDSWWKPMRCPAAGIAHLKEDIQLPSRLMNEDGVDINGMMMETKKSSDTSREILILYNWWKIYRPNRKNPPYELLNKKGSKATIHDLEEIDQVEKRHDKEDEDMMIRLIKVRSYLWT